MSAIRDERQFNFKTRSRGLEVDVCCRPSLNGKPLLSLPDINRLPVRGVYIEGQKMRVIGVHADADLALLEAAR